MTIDRTLLAAPAKEAVAIQEPAPRKTRGKKAEAPERQAREPGKPAEKPAEKPSNQPPARPRAESRPEPRPASVVQDIDDGWNGPVPAFLQVSLHGKNN